MMSPMIRIELVRLAGRHGVGFRVNGGEVCALFATRDRGGLALCRITLRLAGYGDAQKYAHIHLAAMGLLDHENAFADIEPEKFNQEQVLASVELSADPPPASNPHGKDDTNAHLFPTHHPALAAEA